MKKMELSDAQQAVLGLITDVPMSHAQITEELKQQGNKLRIAPGNPLVFSSFNVVTPMLQSVRMVHAANTLSKHDHALSDLDAILDRLVSAGYIHAVSHDQVLCYQTGPLKQNNQKLIKNSIAM